MYVSGPEKAISLTLFHLFVILNRAIAIVLYQFDHGSKQFHLLLLFNFNFCPSKGVVLLSI